MHQNLHSRIPELDGLRGAAIALVLAWHFSQLGPGLEPTPASLLSRALIPLRLTWTGVDLFFVLSGFLIGGILIDSRHSPNFFRVFYTRRFFRIIPLYAAILLLFPSLLYLARLALPADYSWLDQHSFPWYSFLTFTQNFWMAHTNLFGASMLAVTWSLAIEEQFYLTLPFLVRLLSPRRLLILVLTGILLAPILRTALLFTSPTSTMAAFVLMPCRADSLLLGVLAAILLRNEHTRALLQKSTRPFTCLFLVLLGGIAFLLLRAPSQFHPLMQSVGYTWIALFYATLLVFILTHPLSRLALLFRNATLRSLGMLAYGVYLIHQAILGFLFAILWSRPPVLNSLTQLPASAAALAITFALAVLSWRYFESPLIQFSHRLHQAPQPDAANSPSLANAPI